MRLVVRFMKVALPRMALGDWHIHFLDDPVRRRSHSLVMAVITYKGVDIAAASDIEH